jgi:hypothetical protein
MKISIVPTTFGVVMIIWGIYNFRNSERMAKFHSSVSNAFGSGFNLSPVMVKASSVVGIIAGLIVMILGLTGVLK